VEEKKTRKHAFVSNAIGGFRNHLLNLGHCLYSFGWEINRILVLHGFIWEIRESCQGGRHNLEETEGKNWPNNI